VSELQEVLDIGSLSDRETLLVSETTSRIPLAQSVVRSSVAYIVIRAALIGEHPISNLLDRLG